MRQTSFSRLRARRSSVSSGRSSTTSGDTRQKRLPPAGGRMPTLSPTSGLHVDQGARLRGRCVLAETPAASGGPKRAAWTSTRRLWYESEREEADCVVRHAWILPRTFVERLTFGRRFASACAAPRSASLALLGARPPHSRPCCCDHDSSTCCLQLLSVDASQCAVMAPDASAGRLYACLCRRLSSLGAQATGRPLPSCHPPSRIPPSPRCSSQPASVRFFFFGAYEPLAGGRPGETRPRRRRLRRSQGVQGRHS